MRKLWLAWVFLASCQRDGVIARVEGTPVLRSVFDAKLAEELRSRGFDAQHSAPEMRQRVGEAVLFQLVQEAAVEQRATSLGIEITAPELQARMNEFIASVGGPDGFSHYLKQTHQTAEQLRDQVRYRALLRRVIARLVGTIVVSEADVDRVEAERQTSEIREAEDDEQNDVYGSSRPNIRYALMQRTRLQREEQADYTLRQNLKVQWAPGFDPNKL